MTRSGPREGATAVSPASSTNNDGSTSRLDELTARRLRDLPAAATATEEEVRESARRELVDAMRARPALGAFRHEPAVLLRASTITPTPVSWVWRDRIPAAMGTLLAGREGMGKTALVGWIMARLTRGQLPGEWHGRPAHVVYVGAEDDPSSVLVPRWIAAGADLERLHLHAAPARFDADSVAELADDLARLPDVAMVVVDPLDAHLGDRVDTHRKAEVQRAYATLVEELTRVHRCAVVGVAHLSKGDSLDVLRRIVGSVGFTSSARAVLAVGEHPDEPRDRICVLRKANMSDGASTPALRFRVEGHEVASPDGGSIRTATVVVLGEEHGIDPDAILAVPTLAQRTERDEAAAWLREYLADGQPHPLREIEQAATEDGIARATLHRARRDMPDVAIERDESARGRPSTWRRVSSHGVSAQVDSEAGETKSAAPYPLPRNGSEASLPVSSHVSGAGASATEPGCNVCGDADARPYLNGDLCDEHRPVPS